MLKYENIILGLFIINYFFTVVIGYIGLFKIFNTTSLLAQLLGFIFWISNGYIHLRAYTAVIEDHNNKHNKKQP